MISETGHPVGALAHLVAQDAPTLLAAARAVGIATSIAALIAAQGRQTVVRKAQVATSLTVQVEEVRRVRLRTRTT